MSDMDLSLPSAIVVELKLHPSSGAHVTVITASDIGQTSENAVCEVS